MSDSVFKGINVVEFTILGIGPGTGKFFSHYGATVVRVESSLRPDPMRMFPPYADGKPGLNRSVFWAGANSGKRSISLNLNHPSAIRVVRRLIRWCDIVIENFTPGVMEKWGLSYEELKEIKPDVIMISLGNLGHTGPHAGQRGTGGMLQGLAGFTDLLGWPDRGPAMPFGAIADNYPSYLAFPAVIAALLYQRRSGKGQYLDLSQFECAIPFLSPHILDYVVNKRISSRMGNSDPYAAPHGAYRCKGDDRWCAIAVFTEQEWESFCQVIGNPPWVMETRFSNLEGRKANESELDKLVEEWTRTKTAEKVMSLMQAAQVPAGVVENVQDMHGDPQLMHRNHFLKINHPEMGTYAGRNDAFRLSKTQRQVKRAPCLGEDNEFVYKELLGMSEEEYIELLLDGVFE